RCIAIMLFSICNYNTYIVFLFYFFVSSRRRHTRFSRDWSSDVCSSDLFGFYTLLVDGRRAYGWLIEHSPVRRRYLIRFADAFAETGRGLFIGMGLTALIQGALATIEIGRASGRERVNGKIACGFS